MTNAVDRGLRWVALFEASKGILVLGAVLMLWPTLTSGQGIDVDHTVAMLHLQPGHSMANLLTMALSELTPTRLMMLAVLALAYVSLRFTEAYGLWRQHRWAEWLAVISGGIYLPFELAELAHGVSLMWLVVLAVNVLIVLYVARHMLQRWLMRRRAVAG